MNRGLIAFIVAWIGFVALAHGAGEYFELGGQSGWWSSDVNHPVSKGLALFAGKKEVLHTVSFTPDGDWVILFGGNGVWTSNTNLPACKKLIELQNGHTLKCVAFAPGGGWTVFWDQNGNWSEGIPDDAFKKIVAVAKAGGTLRSISFGPNGSWVLLFDKTGVYFGGVPNELAQTLNDAVKNGLTVRCVSFTTPGDWIVLTNNGWWTSNLSLPASKSIVELSRQNQSLKWVAIAPQLGPHDFGKWSQIVHSACDGKLAGGYAFEVLHDGKIVASGAEGWARAPWEMESPSVKWTLDKPMGVASVSKTVTAVAMLKLCQESGRKFSLDDPFWPHIKRVCPTARADVKSITIRQLLTHRSGFKKGDDYTNPKDLEKLLNEPLAHEPGSFYEYQNNNFYIVHLLIEEIGHVQYTPYVKQHVLQPMGIERMETHAEAQRPTCGYGKADDRRQGYPFDWKCETWAGAAGWYASVSDLGRFVNGIREHRVLDEPTTDVMLKQNMGWDYSNPGWVKGGWWVWDEGARAGNFHSAIGHFPDGVDAVMLANCDSPTDVEDLLVKAWRQSMQK
jgi:CubicO group peptidase (beta-lactamase class C family)